MTKLDIAVLEAAKWAWRYDDANPDIGMGPGSVSILQRVLGTGIVYSDIDAAAVLAVLETWHERQR